MILVTSSTDIAAAPVYFTTIREMRRFARKAKVHSIYASINGDHGTDVKVTRKAMLEAFATLDADTPCGGVFYPETARRHALCKIDRGMLPWGS